MKTNNNLSSTIGKKQSLWKKVVFLGLLLYLGISFFFIVYGRVNADEGWYLYASKLVYWGQRPYKDFAYTQTPFLPYVYGITLNILSSNIYIGRATSVSLSMIAGLFSILTARKHAGAAAGGITILLWATFTFGIYYQSITKTYALTTFLFMTAFYVLSSQVGQGWKSILTTTLALLVALTRLSALFFSLPLIIYAFYIVDKKYKIIIVFLCLIAVSWIASLSLYNVKAVIWNLLIHHTAQWGDLSNAEKLADIFSQRIPTLIFSFPIYFLLLFTMILIGYKQILETIKSNSAIFTVVIGLLLFVLPNLVTGGFHPEYFVPLIFTLFPIVGIMFVQIYQQQPYYPRIILQVVLLSSLVLGLIRGGSEFVDVSGNRLPVEEVRTVANFVSENSRLDDKIYALEALLVVMEANRQTFPNMTMAQFSFMDGSTSDAFSFNMINDDITLDYLINGLPQLVILTDLDWQILQKTDVFNPIRMAIENQYELRLEEVNWGQRGGDVQVYMRRVDD